MFSEMIVELAEQLVQAAAIAGDFHEEVHSGPVARYVCLDPETKDLYGFLVENGETIRLYRGHRLLIEPVDNVRQRPPCVRVARWEVV